MSAYAEHLASQAAQAELPVSHGLSHTQAPAQHQSLTQGQQAADVQQQPLAGEKADGEPAGAASASDPFATTAEGTGALDSKKIEESTAKLNKVRFNAGLACMKLALRLMHLPRYYKYALF